MHFLKCSQPEKKRINLKNKDAKLVRFCEKKLKFIQHHVCRMWQKAAFMWVLIYLHTGQEQKLFCLRWRDKNKSKIRHLFRFAGRKRENYLTFHGGRMWHKFSLMALSRAKHAQSLQPSSLWPRYLTTLSEENLTQLKYLRPGFPV